MIIICTRFAVSSEILMTACRSFHDVFIFRTNIREYSQHFMRVRAGARRLFTTSEVVFLRGCVRQEICYLFLV